MKKLLLFLLPLWVHAQNIPIASTLPNNLPYTLPADEAHVSAGIYNGSKLIRTLFNNISQKQGKQSVQWDGYDDDGNLQTPGASFNLKVAYNNDVFSWKQVVGNTSDSLTGASVWRGGNQISAMCLTGTNMNVATGFSEGEPEQRMFAVAHPQQQISYSSQPTATGQSSFFVCASNNYKFWGGCEQNRVRFFIFGERISNNTEIHFSAGTNITTYNGRTYTGAIDVNTSPITAIACQKAGNGYLYIAHSNNTLIVSRTADSTGAIVQTLSIPGITGLTVETDNILWVAQGTTVTKYAINTSTGAVTATGTQITGLAGVVSLDISGGDLAVEDAGNQQVVKRYNSTTLSLTGTIGTPGGYATDPTVSTNKLYLDDVRGTLYTFVTHDGSGGIWVGDAGNTRALHYNSSGTYLEQIQYIGLYTMENTGSNNAIAYNVQTVANQSTSLFIDFMEYTVDYSTYAWTLVNNYGYNLPIGWHNTGTIQGIYKYPNTRRYALIQQASGTMWVGELTASGLRITPTSIPNFAQFDGYGNITTFSKTGTTLRYLKNVVTYNGSNNPVLAPSTTIATINYGLQEPSPATANFLITSSKKIITFDPFVTLPKSGNYYHLAAYDSLTCTRQFRTNIGTQTWYMGDFLPDGSFDIGNKVQRPCGKPTVSGNSIYVPRRDELWKSSENGLFYKWNDMGLLQGIFGVIGLQVVGMPAAYAYASNTQAVSVVNIGGNDFLWANDESRHDGAHLWEISNQSSEGVLTSAFTLDNRILTVPAYATDVLHNVPNGQVSVAGTTGWTQSQADVNHGGGSSPGQFYSVCRSNILYSYLSADVQLFATSGSSGWWQRSITTPTQWTIQAQLDLTINTFIGFELNNSNSAFLDVLDGSGKSIVRIYFYRDSKLKINGTLLGPYTQDRYGATNVVIQRSGSNVYVTMNLWGVPVTYNGVMQDVTADIAHPAAVRVSGLNLAAGFHLGLNSLWVW